MSGLSARHLAAAMKVGQIAGERGSIHDRAAALVEPLRQIVPFQAVWLSVFDDSIERYEPVASHGYDRRLQELFRSRLAVQQLDRLGLNRLRRPLRARDIPGALSDRQVWAEYLMPAGFREGLSMGLFSSDGRHMGLLTLNTDDGAHPTSSARDILGRLAPAIAGAIDPMRSISAAAAMVSTAVAGVVLRRSGASLPLPGLPDHRLLAPGSETLTIAASRVDSRLRHTQFLYPCFPDGTGDHVQITAFAVPHEPFADPVAVVLLSPAPDVRGLTHRELEVLGLLVDGCSNHEIATALTITARTVAAHVEHILTKLNAPTRTAAAVRALREGMYVPKAPPSEGG